MCVWGGGGISIPTFLLTSSLSPPYQQFVPVEEEDVSGHVVILTHYTAFYSDSILCWSRYGRESLPNLEIGFEKGFQA